jgi:hypothetical protein
MAQDQRQEKIYCGKAVERTNQWGQFFSVNLCLTDIPEEHVTTLQDGRKFVNLKVTEMRQPDDRGNTHTVLVDTWKKDNQQPHRERQQAPAERRITREGHYSSGPESFDSDQIPF